MLGYLIVSILTAFGLAVLLVEKGGEWPVKPIRIFLQWLASKIYWRFSQALFCTVCTSFWAALIADLCWFCLSGFSYFAWPVSGFIAVGVTWFLIEFLNAIDR